MLEVAGLTKRFNGGRAGFEDVSFAAAAGEIVGIVGPSGCGKTTLLRVIANLESAQSGTIRWSEPGQSQPRDSIRIGMIFQEPRLMPWLTVLENVAFGLRLSKPERRDVSRRFLELVGLRGFENYYPRELSGGMAQRVAIARSLVTSPEVVLLDEPFSALDAFTRMKLQDLVLDIRAQSRCTLILVTHDIDEALYLCDQILVLQGQPGRVLQTFKLAVPQPRSRDLLEFGQVKREIFKILRLSARGAVGGAARRQAF